MTGRSKWTAAACAMIVSMTAWAADPPSPPAAPPATPAPAHPPADQPMVKGNREGVPDKGFIQKHESFLKRGKEGPIGVLFLGDSITEGWNKAKDVWETHYGKYQPANFGIGGDRTEHVLWRIANGELDGITPKVVVLMLGTNNTGGWSADEIAAGDVKIIKQIHEKLPETKVLILGVFPRGADPEDPRVVEVRRKIADVNTQLAKLDDGKTTRYLDIGDKFLDDRGLIRWGIMPDALHPTPKGYQIWADAMQPLLDEMMK